VIYSKNDYDKVKQAFLQKRIYSGIVVGTEMAAEVYGNILKRGCPLAIIDLDPDEAKMIRVSQAGLTLINSMDYEGACQAVEYLIGLGHTEIGLLAGRMSTYSGRERYKAYMDIMKKHGIPIRNEYILKGEFQKSNTILEVTRMVNSNKLPTAIFSCNDDMALTAINILKARGIKVPDDMSIIGFDDIAIASQVNPALTTVNVPIFDMAKKAVDSVIYAVESGDKSQSLVSLPTKLIIRDSCTNKRLDHELRPF
jgi:LacI family transcriptional regulator